MASRMVAVLLESRYNGVISIPVLCRAMLLTALCLRRFRTGEESKISRGNFAQERAVNLIYLCTQSPCTIPLPRALCGELGRLQAKQSNSFYGYGFIEQVSFQIAHFSSGKDSCMSGFASMIWRRCSEHMNSPVV